MNAGAGADAVVGIRARTTSTPTSSSANNNSSATRAFRTRSQKQNRPLVPVLKRPTWTRSGISNGNGNDVNGIAIGEQQQQQQQLHQNRDQIQNAIDNFRMKGGDEGYKGLASPTKTKKAQNANAAGAGAGVMRYRTWNGEHDHSHEYKDDNMNMNMHENDFGNYDDNYQQQEELESRSQVQSQVQSQSQAWRKDGRKRRQNLLDEDELNGGSDFQINQQCPLRNYCAIADRVRDQFQQAYIKKQKPEETYIMGNRLIKFLSQVLPTHPHYLSRRPECARQRVKIQHDLRKVREQVEEVAILLDKEYYRDVMEAQGLEFEVDVCVSPMKKRRERVRKVRFDLVGSQRIEYNPDPDPHFEYDISEAKPISEVDGDIDVETDNGAEGEIETEVDAEIEFEDDFLNSLVKTYTNGSSNGNDGDHDEFESTGTGAGIGKGQKDDEASELAVWENRDPEADLSLSFSSEGSSFESSFGLHDTSTRAGSNDNNRQNAAGSFGFNTTSARSHTRTRTIRNASVNAKKENDAVVFNAFSISGGNDDGWEHFASQDVSDEMEWPQMQMAQTFHSDTLVVSEKYEMGMGADEIDLTEETEEMEEFSNSFTFDTDVDNCHDHDNNTVSQKRMNSHMDDDAEEIDFPSIEAAPEEDLTYRDFDKSYSDDEENDLSSEMDISFMEKIAMENFYRGIDELQDDDSAEDSWAQQEEGEGETEMLPNHYRKPLEEQTNELPETENDISPAHDRSVNDDSADGDEALALDHPEIEKIAMQDSVAPLEDDNGTLFMDKILEPYPMHDNESPINSAAKELTIEESYFERNLEPDRVESSIDGDIMRIPFAQDAKIFEDESVIDSLEYSSSSSIRNFPSPSTSDYDCTEFDDFDNSQIIAESPEDFDFRNDTEGLDSDDESEHDDYIRKMTELEFSDGSGEMSQSDSSGGGKTIATTNTEETLAMTVEDQCSESSRSNSCENEEEKGNVLGIMRRDTYIPTIDSSHQIGHELAYLESKVKDLQLQRTMEHDKTNHKDEYPIQSARAVAIDVDTNVVEDFSNSNTRQFQPIPQDKPIQQNAPTVGVKYEDASNVLPSALKEETKSPQTTSPPSRARRHPTAARLKALKQSSAWKRRYGRASKD